MLFSVLFSNLFWIAFVLVGLVSGTISLRKWAPKTFTYITTGKWDGKGSEPNDFVKFDMGINLFFHYILWPIPTTINLTSLILNILYVVFSKSIWILIKKAIINIDKAIPKFKIVKED